MASPEKTKRNLTFHPTHSSQKLQEEYKKFIVGNDHPCIMAQTVFKLNEVDMHTYPSFSSPGTVKKLLYDLTQYVANYNFEKNNFVTFLAVFPETEFKNEEQFETALWQLLQQLHEEDSQPWDPTVSSNPKDETFSFSIAGKAFYIVGMHPASLRLARQSPYPTLAFNLHWQFEKLRTMGSYTMVKKRIRKRDKQLQGSINPMLQDFGGKSEAKQYSGRKTGSEWKCPFHSN